MAVFTGKRHKANLKLRTDDVLDVAPAVAALKKYKATKFDQTVNICFHLELIPRRQNRTFAVHSASQRALVRPSE